MRFYNSDKLKLIIALLIYGTIGVVRKNIPYPSSFIAFARAAIGFLFLLCFRVVTRTWIDRAAVKRNLKTLLLSGALLGLNWLLLFEAYNYTSVAVATVCYYMSPVFLTLASPLLGEQLTARKLGCVAVALLGMVLVSGVLETGCTASRASFSALSPPLPTPLSSCSTRRSRRFPPGTGR